MFKHMQCFRKIKYGSIPVCNENCQNIVTSGRKWQSRNPKFACFPMEGFWCSAPLPMLHLRHFILIVYTLLCNCFVFMMFHWNKWRKNCQWRSNRKGYFLSVFPRPWMTENLYGRGQPKWNIFWPSTLYRMGDEGNITLVIFELIPSEWLQKCSIVVWLFMSSVLDFSSLLYKFLNYSVRSTIINSGLHNIHHCCKSYVIIMIYVNSHERKLNSENCLLWMNVFKLYVMCSICFSKYLNSSTVTPDTLIVCLSSTPSTHFLRLVWECIDFTCAR